MERIKEIMLYHGLKKEQYNALKKELDNENYLILVVMSCLATLLLLTHFILSFVFQTTRKQKWIYLVTLICCIIIFLLSFLLVRKHKKIVPYLVGSQEIVLLAFALFASTLGEHMDDKSVPIIAFFVIVPMLFNDRPLNKVVFLTTTEIAYLILDWWSKNDLAYKYDVVNSMSFYIIGVLLGTIFAQIRMGNIHGKQIEKEYLKTLENYNQNLEEEVKNKTSRVLEMNEKLILSMADLVESRDPSTGGHIKRTSTVMKYLCQEIRKDNTLGVSEEFLNCLIKAAPMHDMGKIAIDDSILKNTTAQFTQEQYDVMKKHTVYGGDIVRHILKGTDDAQFVQIAVNVAHYHHERIDGKGYPCGLKGNKIPLEARIMAIADVYDALVSKRCYKEAFSFEKAFEIIENGMGTQFDESLNKYFLKARTKLEKYYEKENSKVK